MERAQPDVPTNHQARERSPMSPEEIEAWLSVKIETAMGKADSDLSENRQKSLQYYRGEPYGDEKEGYSKVVTMETFEAIEWAMPQLVRIFLTGQFAAFIPTSEQDEELAQFETDVINAFLQRETDMFTWCETWMKDTLLNPNGYVKVFIDEARDLRTVEHSNLSMTQVALLELDPNLFNGEVSDGDLVTIPGMMEPVQLYNVKARYLEPNNNIKIEPVPPEEVLVDNDLNTVDLDEAEFVCHHREVTRSELVSMGFDRDMVWGLPTSRQLQYSSEREKRSDFHDEDSHYGVDSGAMEKIDLFECYAKLDVDDDGYAEYNKFLLAARSELLEWGEFDYQPLVALGCYPQPHRHVALSMADVSRENQRISSVLKRQILDNMYRVNRPRMLAGRGVNLEQAMNYVPHGVVQIDGDVGQLQPEQVPVMVQHIMPFMEYVREELDRRTGVTRHAAGLDAETLASSTMGAYLESLGQATQRLEMLARNFAETGYQKVALKVHHLLRTRQQPSLSMKLGEQWAQVDPRQWNPRHRMAARVGIGTGSTKEKLAASMQLMEVQDRVKEFGLANAKRAWRSLEDLTDALGKPSTEAYFVNPASQEYQQWMQQQEQRRQEAMQMQARQQQAAEQAIQVQAEDARTGRQLEAVKEQNRQTEATAKQLLDAEDKRASRFLDAAELELDHQVDIAKVGLDASKVTPLRQPS